MSQPWPQGQMMCAGSWLLSMWGPEISLPREIFGLFLTGALNASTHTYSMGEEQSHAQGQSREWTNLTAQKHPVKFIFIFGPSSPGSLSFVAIQALTHARAPPIFHTSMLPQSQASWWQQGLSWGCHHVHPAPWIFHGHDVPAPAAPRTAGTHTTATLMLPIRMDPSLCRVEVWHLLPMDPILSLSHTSVNSTGECKINPVYNMQPYMMQRWCIGNQVLLLSPFTF